MNLVADESVDRQIVETLRGNGHSILYIAEMDPGISDTKVLDSANEEKAVLLTADKDFGELVYRQRRLSYGVILIRLPGLSPQKKSNIVQSCFHQHSDKFLNSFTVITSGGVRIRKST